MVGKKLKLQAFHTSLSEAQGSNLSIQKLSNEQFNKKMAVKI